MDVGIEYSDGSELCSVEQIARPSKKFVLFMKSVLKF